MTSQWKRGMYGETFAVQKLTEMGYTIVARNVRSAYGEVDIIAEKDDVLCFVEVKTRTGRWLETGMQAVGRTKQRRIIQTALDWMQRFPTHNGQPRFDLFLVETNGGQVCSYTYFEGAFDGEAYTGTARD